VKEDHEQHNMTFVSPSKFAREVGLNRKTVIQAIRNRQLPAVKVGQRYRIDLDAARDWARGAFTTQQPTGSNAV
jgi:excisionase family DNA binding protein